MKTDIYTSTELELLFEAALKTDPSIVPYLALSAFAGLRRDEILNLVPDYIDHQARSIAIVSRKTGRMRVIAGIPDTVWVWLEYCRINQIVFSSHNLAPRLRRFFGQAGVVMKPYGFRQSFARHLLAMNLAIEKTSRTLGVAPSRARADRLRDLPTKAEVKAYFGVKP